MIKFAFECMSNDEPGGATALIFRAFLDGSISDRAFLTPLAMHFLSSGKFAIFVIDKIDQ